MWGAVLLTTAAVVQGAGQMKAGEEAEVAGIVTKRQYETQAKAIEIGGKVEAADKREELLAAISNINAATAASGIVTGSGSVENLRLQAKKEAAKQLSTIRLNTILSATSARSRGAAAAAEGASTKKAGEISAFGSILQAIGMSSMGKGKGGK